MLASTLSFAPPAVSQERYLAANPSDLALLTLVGLSDDTSTTLTDLDSGTELVQSSLDRYQIESLDLAGVHHFALEASQPLLVHFGYDCCGVGGATFVPTEDGRNFVGRAFLLYLPMLGPQSDLYVFALEDATVAITTIDGAPVARRYVPAGRAWQPYPLVGSRLYLVRSSGDLELMLSAVNGLTVVPPAGRDAACEGDVGRRFVFATHAWGTGGAAVFAYEPAIVTTSQLGTELTYDSRELAAGESYFMSGLGRRAWEISATGDITVWAGDMEGGNTIADLGDDFSFSSSFEGRLLLHSLNHGSTLFGLAPETEVEVDGELSRLGELEWLELPPGRLLDVRTDQPVVAITYGGNDLNDWGGYLRPVPRSTSQGLHCPPIDADLPQPADGDADLDADLADSDPDVTTSDAGFDADAPDSSPERPEPSGDEPIPRQSCDCRAARSAPDSTRLGELLRLR